MLESEVGVARMLFSVPVVHGDGEAGDDSLDVGNERMVETGADDDDGGGAAQKLLKLGESLKLE